MSLPGQNPYFTKYLTEFDLPYFKPLFKDSKFVPTGEDAGTYQNLSEKSDTCAWRNDSQNDFPTTLFLYFGRWVEKHVLPRLQKFCKVAEPHEASQRHIDIRNSRVVGAIDILSCLVASLLLEVTVISLVWAGSRGVGLAIVGVFGTIFPALLKLMAGKVTRGEMFTATGGFYAVSAVFLGSTSKDCVCR